MRLDDWEGPLPEPEEKQEAQKKEKSHFRSSKIRNIYAPSFTNKKISQSQMDQLYWRND